CGCHPHQCMPQCQPGQQQPNFGGTLQQDCKGKPIEYTTSGGYKVTVNHDKVTILDPCGNKVEQSGDPHEHVNGKHIKDWDGKARSIILPDGTKITMNASGPHGVTEHTSIYDGTQNVQIDNRSNTVESRSFNPWDTAGRERTQMDGETAYMGYGQDGSLIYRNIYKQNENGQVIPFFQDLARTRPGGGVVDLFDDPRLGHT
ncbi:MAG: hypothetical protein AB1758_20395, partial [Candidatus Eremiobacterota bacterium]